MSTRLAKAQRYLVIIFIFAVVLAIFPLTSSPAVHIKVLAYETCAAMGLFLWALFGKRTGKSASPLSSPLNILFVLFALGSAVSAIGSMNWGYSLLQELTGLVALTAVFFIVAHSFRTAGQIWGMIIAVCIAVTLASAYGMIQYLGWDPFPWADETGVLRQAPATFGNPNLASHTLLPATILVCGLATQRRTRWGLLAVPLFLFHFSLTQTRGSLLGLAGALFLVITAIIVSRKVHRPARAMALTLTILLVAGIAAGALVGGAYRARTGHPFPTDDSVRQRYHSFYSACRLIKEQPLVGHGLGMFSAASPPFWTSLEKERFSQLNKMSFHVHNEPLEIAAETGLPTAIFYLGILLFGLCQGLGIGFSASTPDRRWLGFTLAGFFLAFILDGCFGFNFHAPASAFLLVLAAGAVAGLQCGQTEREEPTQSGWSGRVLLGRFGMLALALALLATGVSTFYAQFMHQRGRGALSHEVYTAAANCFSTAATWAPYDWLHPHLQGVAAMETHGFGKAAAHFERALVLNPNYIHALFRCAQAYFNVAEDGTDPDALQQSLEKARRAAMLDSYSPEVHDLLGRIAFLRAQRMAADPGETPDALNEAWLEAETHLLTAVEQDSPQKATLLRIVAVERLARSDVKGAQQALVRALETAPEDQETWQLFLQISRETGQYDALRQTLDWCIKRLADKPAQKKDLSAVRVLKAQTLYEGYADAGETLHVFRSAVLNDPGSASAWDQFYAFARETGNTDAFLDALSDVQVDEDRDEALPPIVEAAAASANGKGAALVDATRQLAQAIQRQELSRKEGTPETPYAWAVSTIFGQAQRANLSSGEQGEIFLTLGVLFSAAGEFETALEAYDQALPHLLAQQRVFCLLRKGAACVETGKAQEAITALEEVIQNAPMNLEARHALAQALAMDGQYPRARQEYRRILTRFNLDPASRQAVQSELNALPQ